MPTPTIQSGRTTPTPQSRVEDRPGPSSEPSSRRHQELESSTGLAGRAQSARLASTGADSGRPPRQPLSEITPGSPESLLGDSLRSDHPSFASTRFSDVAFSSATELSGHPELRRRPAEAETSLQIDDPAAQTEAGRSWQSVGQALMGGLAQVGRIAHQETIGMAQHMAASLAELPGVRMAGVVAGHFIHQTVAVGMSTLTREMIGMGFAHLMRAEPASTVIGVQAAMAGANLAMQAVREFRERRNPDEAARAYHSLTPQQWASATPEQQDKMRKHTQLMSRMFTLMQVASSATNLAMVSMNTLHLESQNLDRDSPEFVSAQTAAMQPLVNDVKVAVYAAFRDTAQASFSMVEVTNGRDGISGPAEPAAAVLYGGFYALNGYLSTILKDKMVPDAGDAVATLMGDSSSGMSAAHAWGTVATSAAISGMLNVLPEATDWTVRTEMQNYDGPGTQAWSPERTGTDYGRLLDQMPGRAAYFNGLFSALTLGGEVMARNGFSNEAQAYIGAAAEALIMIGLDSPTMGLWQAAGAVRTRPEGGATPPPPASSPDRPASGVTLTELEEGQSDDPATDPVEAGPAEAEPSRPPSERSGASQGSRASAGFPPEPRPDREPSPRTSPGVSP